MRYEIKELSLGGVLDQAVALLKDHVGLFVGVTLVLQIPFGLIQGFVTVAIVPPPPPNPTPDESAAYLREFIASLPILGPLGLLQLLVVIPLTNAH